VLEMKLKPIGTVKRISNRESVLDVERAYITGLEGLGPGTKIQVLYWMHELTPKDRMTLKAHPKGDASRPERGVFSLRCQVRPNPIGVTIVEVVGMDGPNVVVQGLDARDHSPLIDIKAYPGS
jgi:tRNA-Thr(GGU) m(6)t(6)A37 methyltransferase TsaA